MNTNADHMTDESQAGFSPSQTKPCCLPWGHVTARGGGKVKVRPPPVRIYLYSSAGTNTWAELSWAELRPHAAALANIWWTPTSGFFLTLAVGIHFTHPAASCWTDTWHWTLISVDMFGPGQLVSTLLPTVFHSPVAQFFPAFPTRLASQPQILIPGPFITYESLRNYLQPDPCKEALLVATQAVGMGSLAEVIGRAKCF